MKKLFILSLALICGALSYSQSTDSSFYFLTQPSETRGYLSWVDLPDANYEIEIYKKILENGEEIHRSILRQDLRNNYVQIDKQFTISSDYFYQLKAINPSGGLIAETDILSVGNYPSLGPVGGDVYLEECSWVCNGSTYAWELVLYLNPNAGNGKLCPKSAFAYYDEDEGAIPYFEAMSPSVFDARGYSASDLIAQNHYSAWVDEWDDVRDAGGTILTGEVHFMGKLMQQYTPLQLNYTDVLTLQSSDCSWPTTHAINMYNNPSYHTDEPLPLNLECIPATPSGGMGHGDDIDDGSEEDEDEGENVSFLHYLLHCKNGDVFWANSWNLEEITAGLPCDGEDDGQSSDSGWTPTDFTHNGTDIKLRSLFISRIDKPEAPVTIDASDIFDVGDPYVAQTYNFETGLYQVNFVFSDLSCLPFVVEHNTSENPPTTNSDFASLVLAPNPVEDLLLNFEVEVERKMKIEMEVVSLDGETLLKERRIMEENTSLRRTIKIEDGFYPYSQLLVKLTFEDGSTIEKIALIDN